MNNIKKINLLLCLIFSFVFFFSNVFSVEATTVNIYEDAVLEKILNPKYPGGDVVACKFTYITVDNGEREVIWAIKDITAWNKSKSESCYFIYSCTKKSHEISQDGSSAKIFVTITEYDITDWWWPVHRGDYNLTFELSLD